MVQKLTGLVLRTTEYKESDLILNILTREQGLISAKARAVRTNRSHNKGACQLLCYSEFTITDYKGFSAISEANAIEMFPELRSDIELLSLLMNSSLAALVKLRSVATLLKTFSLVSIILCSFVISKIQIGRAHV